MPARDPVPEPTGLPDPTSGRQEAESLRRARVVAVTSGKGGVGKTMISANLAASLSNRGLKVLVIDADLGLANLDVALNLQPRYTLHDVLVGRQALKAALLTAPMGFQVLPAGSGLVEYSSLTPQLRRSLRQLVDEAAAPFDVVLLDTGAGISEVVLHTISLADEVLVVATPDPTALTDAYATIKVVCTLQRRRHLMLLVNQVTRPGEGLAIRHQMQAVVDRYLGPLLPLKPELQMLGELPQDDAAREAVRRRQLVLHTVPGSDLSRGLQAVAARLEGWLLGRGHGTGQGLGQRSGQWSGQRSGQRSGEGPAQTRGPDRF